jgi:hypothetical protein
VPGWRGVTGAWGRGSVGDPGWQGICPVGEEVKGCGSNRGSVGGATQSDEFWLVVLL